MDRDELWLSDLKVLDLSRLLPGPFCTLLLADMGADVLKIENPEGGDYARHYPPRVDGVGAFFAAVNRNKRSMTLNLKTDRGVELLEELVSEADVLVESFRPGVMDRLGVGYSTLSDINPELIFCAITGYGSDGPLTERAGHDLNYMAKAGLLDQNGRHDGPPVVPGFQVADIAGGGLYAALSIVSALYGREKSGQGEFLDISMTEGALSFHLPVQASQAAGEDVERGGGMLTGGIPSYHVYRTQDGEYLSVGALEPKFWMKVVDLVDAPQLASSGLDRGESGREAQQKLAEIFASKPLDAWLDIFEGEDVCCEPVESPAEVAESELFEARRMFFQLAGVRHTRTPVTPENREHSPAPELGAHTGDVLGELGVSDADIERLRDHGVV